MGNRDLGGFEVGGRGDEEDVRAGGGAGEERFAL